MNYKQQLERWLAAHPEAGEKEAKAWVAGYFQCVENWCNKER